MTDTNFTDLTDEVTVVTDAGMGDFLPLGRLEGNRIIQIFGAEFSLGPRMKLLLAVLALISAGPASADCPKAGDWARAFYSEHYFFYADAPDPILQFTTPEFGALLKKEWAYSKGEVGHLDYDPWLGAQDGELGKPVRFSVEMESPDTAVVAMSYPFVLDPKRPPERHTAHLVLRRREHECWHLQDFITPKGESLSYVFSAVEP